MKNGRGRKSVKVPNYGRTFKESLAIKKMLDKLPEIHYRTWKEAFTPEEWAMLRKTRRTSL
ncbi:MAG: hypothetical protein HYT87_14500 [Nitrospirae bacterium]|nr:hypothetical protein [Nitrospirota bacterium]